MIGIALDGREFKPSKVVILFEGQQYRPGPEGWEEAEQKPLVFVPLSEGEPDPRPEGATEVTRCFGEHAYVFHVVDGFVVGVWLAPTFKIDDEYDYLHQEEYDPKDYDPKDYDPSQEEVIDVLDSWEENDGSISKVVLLANGNVDIRTQGPEPKVNVNSHNGYVDNLDDFPF